MDPFAGQIIAGKFRVEERIGEGSMGSVWGARHLGLNVPVALKFMSPDLVSLPRALARFEREAQSAARIRSPHVVQVLDHGVDGGTPFIVMEWLEGEDLGARLRRVGRVPLQEAVVIAEQAAKALRAAHEAGVIHRDLKPGNIFLARVQGEEVVKLLDFGVAKVEPATAQPATDGTGTGVLVGTPEYMSPEQIRGSKELDHRTDVWSLGMILYVAITGKRPFRGETLGEVMLKVCTAPLPPPSTIVFDLPPVIDWFFDRACAREPANRFQTAADLAAAFAQAAQGRAAPRAAAPPPAGPGSPAGAPAAGPAGARGAAQPQGAPLVYISSSMRGQRGSAQGGSSLTLVSSLLLALVFILLFVALGKKEIESILKDIWMLTK